MIRFVLVGVALALSVLSSRSAADTLKVGSVFPSTRFQSVDQDGTTSLASMEQVQRQKAIVFVFASW